MRRLGQLALFIVLATAVAAGPLSAQAPLDRGWFAQQVDSLAEAFLTDGPTAGVAIAVEKDGETRSISQPTAA